MNGYEVFLGMDFLNNLDQIHHIHSAPRRTINVRLKIQSSINQSN